MARSIDGNYKNFDSYYQNSQRIEYSGYLVLKNSSIPFFEFVSQQVLPLMD